MEPTKTQQAPPTHPVTMKASKVAIDLIKKWEGFRAKAYNCPANHATIGFGTLLHFGPITPDDKKLVYTESLATEKLVIEVAKIESGLRSIIKVPVTQNQFNALCCWTYNLGLGAAKSSSWLRSLNAGKYSEVPRQLQLWSKARVNGVLVEVKGLVNRRKDEADLFIKQ